MYRKARRRERRLSCSACTSSARCCADPSRGRAADTEPRRTSCRSQWIPALDLRAAGRARRTSRTTRISDNGSRLRRACGRKRQGRTGATSLLSLCRKSIRLVRRHILSDRAGRSQDCAESRARATAVSRVGSQSSRDRGRSHRVHSRRFENLHPAPRAIDGCPEECAATAPGSATSGRTARPVAQPHGAAAGARAPVLRHRCATVRGQPR